MILKKNRVHKIPVAILGATGMIGQTFIELLSNHPWFEIAVLAASEKSVGKSFKEAANWMMLTPLHDSVANCVLQSCQTTIPCQVIFSALPSSEAKILEPLLANRGHIVISNSSSHRMDENTPLLIPEVNSDHLGLIRNQQFGKGMIVTNPNCSVIGLTLALKPLVDQVGVKELHVVTMQAVSGAGYPGVSSLDMIDNIVPFIDGEEEKIESEPLKILGTFKNQSITPSQIKISAHCNRVPVMNGHMACVSVKVEKRVEARDLIQSWKDLKGLSGQRGDSLPSAPVQPIIYLENEKHPQPKLHRELGRGMSVSIGRLRACSLNDWKFVILSHNTLRGAAGCAVLNAELMVQQGLIPI